MRLHELATLIRSKNAGPFTLTIDVMFDRPEHYAVVRDSGLLCAQRIAEIYAVPAEQVQVFHYEPARAIKISMPRPHPSGSLDDGDVYGGQFHSPLVLLELASA
jgi:hypothetical protein